MGAYHLRRYPKNMETRYDVRLNTLCNSFVDISLAFAGVESVQTLGNTLATLLVPVYTFLALRMVYGQGWLMTLAKLVVLLFGYVMFLSLTLLGTLIVTEVVSVHSPDGSVIVKS